MPQAARLGLGVSILSYAGQVRLGVITDAGLVPRPGEIIDHFEKEMQAAGVDYTLVNYPGVKHSFTNPDADSFGKRFDMPLAYDAGADADSWTRLQEFLKAIFSR